MHPRHFLAAAAVGVAMSAAACGYAIKVTTDYDHLVHFANYSTFCIMAGASSGNPILDQRAEDDVRQAITSKGWREVPLREARAIVVLHGATRTRRAHEAFYQGWGGWHWRWGGMETTTTLVEEFEVGTLIVDVFDADTKRAIWHGYATGALSDSAKEDAKITSAAVTKMFSKFPPREPDR